MSETRASPDPLTRKSLLMAVPPPALYLTSTTFSPRSHREFQTGSFNLILRVFLAPIETLFLSLDFPFVLFQDKNERKNFTGKPPINFSFKRAHPSREDTR